mgnify:CR=1 FL=1
MLPKSNALPLLAFFFICVLLSGCSENQSTSVIRYVEDHRIAPSEEYYDATGYWGISVSRKNNALLTTTYDTLTLRQLDSLEVITRETGNKLAVKDIDLSSDAAFYVSAHVWGVWRIWDAKSGNILVERQEATEAIEAVAIAPNDELIAIGDMDGTISIYDLKKLDSPELRGQISAHLKQIDDISFSTSGAFLASTSRGLETKIWHTGSLERRVQIRHSPYSSRAKWPLSVIFSPRTNYILTIGNFGLDIYRLSDGKIAGFDFLVGENPTDIEFTPDGKRLAVSDSDGMLRFFDWSFDKRGASIYQDNAMKSSIERLNTNIDGRFHFVFLNNSGSSFATAHLDGPLVIWAKESLEGFPEGY